MRITGLDLGTVGGWFKLDTDRMNVDYGIFEAPKGTGEGDGPRLVRFQRRIDEILADRPELLTYEDVTFVKNANAGRLVPVQMGGVLKMRLEQLGLEGAGVNVSTLKKFATGRGRQSGKVGDARCSAVMVGGAPEDALAGRQSRFSPHGGRGVDGDLGMEGARTDLGGTGVLMETAMIPAFVEERTRERIEALGDTGFLAVEPLLELLEYLEEERTTLERWGMPSESIDTFRAKLIEACEEGAKGVHHWKPASVVARLVRKTPETVRTWCRRDLVRNRRKDDGSYIVHVPSAIKHNESLSR